MKSLRLLDRRAGYSLASIGLLLGVIAPAALPAFASAGQLNSRSISMSDSAGGASGVKYTLNFTPETGISVSGGIEVDFCADSPIVDTACNVTGNVTGLTATGVGMGTVLYNTTPETSAAAGTVAAATGNLGFQWTAGTAITAGTPIHLEFTGIHNPTAAETFYARVTTYATSASSYVSTTNAGSYSDNGAIALSTTEKIGVTAYVQESMSFCVSAADPSGDCGTDGGSPIAVTTPSVELGQEIGTSGQFALDTATVSNGSVYAQLSTNASHGAVVNLKSDATSCGGLYLNGDTTKCNIAPQTTAATGIAHGNALFGVTVGSVAPATDAPTPSGTLQAAGSYDDTNYYMNYVAGNGTGVTSTYGDPLFNSNSLPVNNQNITIGLGASISNSTAAGKYGANLSLIAAGTF